MADAEFADMRCCDECGSDYFATASQMSRLCNDCAHWLYGYPQCSHAFVQGCCSKCGWNGSVSAYVRALQAQQSAGTVKFTLDKRDIAMSQAQPHTELTDEQKHLLEELYARVPLSVDDLPYTDEMQQIHRDFVQQSGLSLAIRDVYKALKNLGRQGRLGGKFRSTPASQEG